ncbi:MAG: hypothetical protein SCALA702_31220 [Melioribacteraceae bacterium]|nr:MAG: hypothetical protein SCALA702_31220 [Melioribacteraceae bacterium]
MRFNKAFILITILSALTISGQSTINLNLLVRFNSILNSSEYRMIGLPGNSGFKISELIDGKSGYDWLAFYDDGTGKLIPHTDGIDHEFTFETGLAFWLISKENFRLQNLTAPVSEKTEGAARISLHSGWNMITNPYDTSISWDVVKSANNINDRIYYFKEGRYSNNSLRMEPYLGYYFFNRFDKEYLEIPASSGTIYKENGCTDIDTVKIVLKSGMEILSSYTLLLSEYDIENDVYTQFAPPGNFSKTDIFTQDYFHSLPTSENIITLDDQVTIPVTIKNKVNNIEFEIVSSNKSIDIKLTDHFGYEVDYIPSSETAFNYNLYIQKTDSDPASPIPGNYLVSSAYPNPFNPATKIRVALPEASEVTLEVFSSIGELVKVVNNSYSSPGYYDIPVVLSERSSGVYIYRIQNTTGELFATGKIMLQK